jgi:hypothetical protein
MGQYMAWGALLRLLRSPDRRHLSLAALVALAAGAALRWAASRSSVLPPVRATGAAGNLPREQGSHLAG